MDYEQLYAYKTTDIIGYETQLKDMGRVERRKYIRWIINEIKGFHVLEQESDG